jgi:hypothetical protein
MGGTKNGIKAMPMTTRFITKFHRSLPPHRPEARIIGIASSAVLIRYIELVFDWKLFFFILTFGWRGFNHRKLLEHG